MRYRSSMTSDNKFYMWVLVIAVVIAFTYTFFSYNNVGHYTTVVRRTEMQQEISSGSSENSNVSTKYHFRVYTDAGLFEVEQGGILYAHPELIGQINEGDTLNITTRGFNWPQLSIYPSIVAVFR